MRATFIEILLYMGLGALIMWYLIPNKIVEIPGINKIEYKGWLHDTTTVIEKEYIEKVVFKPKLVYVKDTSDSTAPMPTEFLAEYDKLTDSLSKSSALRLKTYQAITDTKDTVDLTLESIRDSIMDLSIRFGVREVMRKQIRTIYVPEAQEPEEWWVKPAIATGGIIIGYGLGSIK